jgi:D-alanine-D-alanine ligase
LTVLSDKAPMVALPSLIGKYDYDQYVRELGPRGISYYIADQVYDPKQEENTILHLFLDEQKITDEDIRKGLKIPQGSRLGFVVTVRRTGEVKMPDIICQRYSTASFVIGGTNLVIGKVYAEGISNRDDAFVVKTEPAAGSMLDVGKPITIYLSAGRPDGCE